MAVVVLVEVVVGEVVAEVVALFGKVAVGVVVPVLVEVVVAADAAAAEDALALLTSSLTFPSPKEIVLAFKEYSCPCQRKLEGIPIPKVAVTGLSALTSLTAKPVIKLP